MVGCPPMVHAPPPPRGRLASATPVFAARTGRVLAGRTLAGRTLLPCVLLCALTAAGCTQQGRAPAARFVEQADRLHDGALASTVTPDPDLTEYIQDIGKRLERAAQEIAPDKARGPFFQSMKFHVVDVPVINAFTTGGQHVYVYRGLFDFCQSEEELAAAMAHAYAHALNLDVENTGMTPAAAGDERPLRLVAWDFVANRFDAVQEEEADELAFRLYARGGWDPARFGFLFSRLSDREGGNAAAAPDRLSLPTRGARARGMTAGVPRSWRQEPVADPVTYADLRARAESLRYVSAAAEQGNNEALLYLVAFPNCIMSYDAPAQLRAQELLRPPPPPPVDVEPN
jgi:hypothetical protein